MNSHSCVLFGNLFIVCAHPVTTEIKVSCNISILSPLTVEHYFSPWTLEATTAHLPARRRSHGGRVPRWRSTWWRWWRRSSTSSASPSSPTWGLGLGHLPPTCQLAQGWSFVLIYRWNSSSRLIHPVTCVEPSQQMLDLGAGLPGIDPLCQVAVV